MSAPRDPRPESEKSAHERRMGNLILLGLFAAVVAVAVWLANSMLTQRAIDDCATQGRRNCVPLGSGADQR